MLISQHTPRIRQQIRPLLDTLRDLVYPPTCASCHTPIPPPENGLPLCSDCQDDLVEIAPPFCSICCEPYSGNIDTDFRCSNCHDRDFAFEFAISHYRNCGTAREIVHRLKYQKEKWLRKAMAEMLAPAFADPRVGDHQEAILVPIPMHPVKQRERGFNQAEEIARSTSKITGIPTLGCLRRLKPSPPQARLSRDQRLANLQGAFGFAKKHRQENIACLRGKTAILIDDVLTTGATAHHAATALKEAASPGRIIVATSTRA